MTECKGEMDMKMKHLLWLLPVLVLLTGCAMSAAEDTTLPEANFTTQPTTAPVTEPTTQPTTVPPTVPPTVPETEEVAPPELPEDVQLTARYSFVYDLDSNTAEGTFLDEEYLLELRMYLFLQEDGTGQMSVLGQGMDITWNETSLIMDGSEADYTLGDGTLIIQEGLNCVVFRYVGQELPEEYLPVFPVGFFAVASVGRDGNVAFYPTVDPANGYIRIREDHTGDLFFDDQLREFTMDEVALYLDGESAMYQYIPTSVSGDTEDLLMVIFYGDTVTSIAFRPASDPENT